MTQIFNSCYQISRQFVTLQKWLLRYQICSLSCRKQRATWTKQAFKVYKIINRNIGAIFLYITTIYLHIATISLNFIVRKQFLLASIVSLVWLNISGSRYMQGNIIRTISNNNHHLISKQHDVSIGYQLAWFNQISLA